MFYLVEQTYVLCRYIFLSDFPLIMLVFNSIPTYYLICVFFSIHRSDSIQSQHYEWLKIKSE